MTRDFSQFLGNTAAPAPKLTPLQLLGWQPFFAQQTDTDEMVETPPVRITEVHRNGLHAIGDGIDEYIAPVERATVGDWFLLNRDFPSKSRLLERKSLIKRRAAGHDRTVQFIAANLDTAFIVTSCNADFNVARLERYIALALDADVDPVIILTKSDMADDPETYAETARQISDLVPVVTLDARADEPKEKLAQWCKPGKTVGFIGSSGVGKSTLTNALSGTQDIETADIREDDARGRHTTTRRQLHFIPISKTSPMPVNSATAPMKQNRAARSKPPLRPVTSTPRASPVGKSLWPKITKTRPPLPNAKPATKPWEKQSTRSRKTTRNNRGPIIFPKISRGKCAARGQSPQLASLRHQRQPQR
jgi:ribosome biogenesis GTPase